jgi:hypothetical protein
MAHLDLGQVESKPRDGQETVLRTQVMLVMTAVGAVSIVVVAALFVSLF